MFFLHLSAEKRCRLAWFVRRQFDYELSASFTAACLASLIGFVRKTYRVAKKLFVIVAVLYGAASFCLDIYLTIWLIANDCYSRPVYYISLD
jgi:hypothetical protein